MQEWLIHLVNQHTYIVYAVIVFVSFIEGPILSMLCGLLVKLGDVHFLPIYIALMIGDLIGDVFWYHVGYYFGPRFVKRFGKYFSIYEKDVASVEKIFHKYKNRILIISKVTMGFGFALVTLVTAGMVKIPFRRYITLNFIGQFVWTGLLMIIGYEFGHVYESVNGILSKLSVAALFIIAFAAMIGYGKYVKSKMSKSIQTP